MTSRLRHVLRTILFGVALVALLTPIAVGAQQAPLPTAPPETQGMSAARLARLNGAFKKEIEDKKVPGVVMMIARKGKLVFTSAQGLRDPRGTDPMRLDTIFRIYSMTKPMASVATMILVEDGTVQLTDPVSKWLPAFKDMKVSTTGGDVPAQRPMTVQDLLRHTAGLPYGELTQNAAVKDALAQAGLFKPGVIDFDIRDMTAAEQVERLGKIPLIHQPGTTWEYSLASDVLGRVVEAASGKRLGDFMGERLFKPLKMSDTAFWVPEAKITRVAEPFEKDPLASTPDQADRSREAARQRLRRRRRDVDGGRLSALRPDAGERRGARRAARAEPHYRQAHDLRPPGLTDPAGGEPGRERARRIHLYLRPRVCRAPLGRHRADPGIGRRLQLGRLRRHDLLGRSQGAAGGGVHGAIRRAPCARTTATSSGSSCTRRSSTSSKTSAAARSALAAARSIR
jgi:CubicO group peptidase (beta-lactamase class C family)